MKGMNAQSAAAMHAVTSIPSTVCTAVSNAPTLLQADLHAGNAAAQVQYVLRAVLAKVQNNIAKPVSTHASIMTPGACSVAMTEELRPMATRTVAIATTIAAPIAKNQFLTGDESHKLKLSGLFGAGGTGVTGLVNALTGKSTHSNATANDPTPQDVLTDLFNRFRKKDQK
jgi:hypothetical protein